jgi:hypothetical protein
MSRSDNDSGADKPIVPLTWNELHLFTGKAVWTTLIVIFGIGFVFQRNYSSIVIALFGTVANTASSTGQGLRSGANENVLPFLDSVNDSAKKGETFGKRNADDRLQQQ